MAGNCACRVDDLPDRVAGAVAEVVGCIGAARKQMLKRQQVGPGEVGYMHVVPQAGAVGGRVVVTEYHDRFALTGCDLQHQRYQVGLRLVPFTDLAGPVSTGGVEVTQDTECHAVRVTDIGEQAFDRQLGRAIGIGWCAGMVFRDRRR